MTSRKLNFDEETKQFIAIYTNIKGEEIEKIFTRQQADKTFKEIVKFWKDVDQLSIYTGENDTKGGVYGRNKKEVLRIIAKRLGKNPTLAGQRHNRAKRNMLERVRAKRI